MKKILSFITSLVIFIPHAVAAATVANELPNPLGTNDTIPKIIGSIVTALLSIVGSVALLVFIYGGFLWLTAHGEEKQVKQGWDTMIWAALGLGVIFASYALVTVVFKALNIH